MSITRKQDWIDRQSSRASSTGPSQAPTESSALSADGCSPRVHSQADVNRLDSGVVAIAAPIGFRSTYAMQAATAAWQGSG